MNDLVSTIAIRAQLIKELKAKLTEVETEVTDAFKDLEDTASAGH